MKWLGGLLLLGACTQFVAREDDDAGLPPGPGPSDAATESRDVAAVPSADGSSVVVSPDADGPVPPPPVERMAEHLADVVSFSVEGERAVWNSTSQGIRSCVLGSCASTLVVSKTDDLLPGPVLLAHGKVYYTERHAIFPGLYQKQIAEVGSDGTGRTTVIQGAVDLGPQLAVGETGVYCTYSKAVDDGVYDNFLVHWDGAAGEVLKQRAGFSVPFPLATAGALLAIAQRSGQTRTVQRVVGSAATVVGVAPGATALAVDAAAVYALAGSTVYRCTDACQPLTTAGDAGAGFTGLALVGERLLMGVGAALWTCTVAGAGATCAQGPELGFSEVLDVQASGGRFYVLGVEPAGADAAATMGISRVNF